MEIYLDDEAKLTLHGLVQHYIKLSGLEKTRKLIDLLDAFDFNQVVIFVKSVSRAAVLNKLLSVTSYLSASTLACLWKKEERGVIFFVSMLRRCPYLPDLTLWGSGDYGTEIRLLGLDYWEKQERFNCFNHTLQRVTIGWETKYEIEFAKYVLAKAEVLKHLTVIRIMTSRASSS